jgi:hypothetical protein
VHAAPDARPFESSERRFVRLAAAAPVLVATALVVIAFVIYLLCSRGFSSGRGDFFYLADAFLHSRTWLLSGLGPNDNVVIGSRVYVPFAPFPAILVLPLVAIVGPQTADKWQPIVNAALAAGGVGLVWILAGRIGVRRWSDRVWLAVLFGFSTQIWWVDTRGGVWHTGHLVASVLTLLILIELFGRSRMLLVGLLAGGAFLTRAPLVFAVPFYGLWSLLDLSAGRVFRVRFAALRDRAASAVGALRAVPIRAWALLVLGFLPGALFYLWYNDVRFGSPFESGYGMATLPPFLEAQRRLGLFSLAHLAMNLDYLLWHLPSRIPDAPFFRPDGLGMSILITSPGLLLAVRAPWSDRRTWLLAGAFLFTLIPSLLYYGGGWLQFGYRYALDAIPFAVALCCMAVAWRGGIGLLWKVLIVFGVLINAAGVYWAYRI